MMNLFNFVSIGLLLAECHAFPTIEHLGRLAGDQLDARTQDELRIRAVESENIVEARASFDAAAQLIDGKYFQLIHVASLTT